MIDLSDERFEKFMDLLLECNEKYNLTAITDREGVYCKHFYDSVAPEKHFKNGAKVVEVGSGGGFPSIPLKICRGDLNFTLIESTGKKCNFLSAAIKELGLEGMTVLNSRAEEAARLPSLREKFDVAEARAVASLNTLSEYCLPFVKVGGYFIAYKGIADEEIENAANAVAILGGAIEKTEKYSLPDGSRRTVILIKKIKPTPPKYPRGKGLERKSPL